MNHSFGGYEWEISFKMICSAVAERSVDTAFSFRGAESASKRIIESVDDDLSKFLELGTRLSEL